MVVFELKISKEEPPPPLSLPLSKSSESQSVWAPKEYLLLPSPVLDYFAQFY